jgi:hypothetical protein
VILLDIFSPLLGGFESKSNSRYFSALYSFFFKFIFADLLGGVSQPVVVWLNGSTLFLFEKKLKKTISLKSLRLETTESELNHHHLICSQNNLQILCISVPEPLLLVRWIGAFSSCGEDVIEKSNDFRKSVSITLKKLVFEENKRSTMKLGWLLFFGG